MKVWGCHLTEKSSAGVDPPLIAQGGVLREEAIMLLRRFYIQENQKGTHSLKFVYDPLKEYKAPDPKVKKKRELNTELYQNQ